MFAPKGNKEFCFARVSTRNKDDRFQQFFDEINILRGRLGKMQKVTTAFLVSFQPRVLLLPRVFLVRMWLKHSKHPLFSIDYFMIYIKLSYYSQM